jgi:hypothetical protein
VATTINSTIRTVTSPFTKAGTWLIGKGSDVVEGLYGGIRNRFTSLGNAVETAIYHVEHPFNKAGGWLFQAGRQVLSGLGKGMMDGLRAAGNWASHVAGDIIRAVKSHFGIRSPSTVMMGIGTNLITSLFRSMIAHNPVPVITKIFGGMPEALGALADKGLVSIKNLPKKALNALSGLGGKFAGLLGFGGGGGGAIRLGGLSAAESWIVMHESGGRTNAQNPTSTAFGLGQLLIANRQHYGAILGVSPSTTNYADQVKMFRMYVRDRYGTAENAENFWKAHGWYGTGGVVSRPSLIGAGEHGPERVLTAAQTRSFEHLVQVLARPRPAGGADSMGASIDYAKLGDHVARAFVRAGVSVRMDGKAVGQIIGGTASLLGRTA